MAKRMRFICRAEVTDMVGLSYVNLLNKIKRGTFPAPRRVDEMPMWYEHEVLAWMEARPLAAYRTGPSNIVAQSRTQTAA